MAESALHKALVRRLERAVVEVLGNDVRGICIVDRGGGYRDAAWMIGGSYPDVRAFGHGVEVIGEAKPPWDLGTEHTKRQLATYLRYLEQVDSAYLVLSVRWDSSPTARNALRVCARDWTRVRDRVSVLDGDNRLTLFDGPKS